MKRVLLVVLVGLIVTTLQGCGDDVIGSKDSIESLLTQGDRYMEQISLHFGQDNLPTPVSIPFDTYSKEEFVQLLIDNQQTIPKLNTIESEMHSQFDYFISLWWEDFKNLARDVVSFEEGVYYTTTEEKWNVDVTSELFFQMDYDWIRIEHYSHFTHEDEIGKTAIGRTMESFVEEGVLVVELYQKYMTSDSLLGNRIEETRIRVTSDGFFTRWASFESDGSSHETLLYVDPNSNHYISIINDYTANLIVYSVYEQEKQLYRFYSIDTESLEVTSLLRFYDGEINTVEYRDDSETTDEVRLSWNVSHCDGWDTIQYGFGIQLFNNEEKVQLDYQTANYNGRYELYVILSNKNDIEDEMTNPNRRLSCNAVSYEQLNNEIIRNSISYLEGISEQMIQYNAKTDNTLQLNKDKL